MPAIKVMSRGEPHQCSLQGCQYRNYRPLRGGHLDRLLAEHPRRKPRAAKRRGR